MTAPSAVRSDSPVSGSRSASTRTIPSNVAEARAPGVPAGAPRDRLRVRAPHRPATPHTPSGGRGPSGGARPRRERTRTHRMPRALLRGLERARAAESETPPSVSARRVAGISSSARAERTCSLAAPHHVVRPCEPGRGRQMSAAFVEAATVDLRQPAQPFELPELARALQFREVLLDPRPAVPQAPRTATTRPPIAPRSRHHLTLEHTFVSVGDGYDTQARETGVTGARASTFRMSHPTPNDAIRRASGCAGRTSRPLPAPRGRGTREARATGCRAGRDDPQERDASSQPGRAVLLRGGAVALHDVALGQGSSAGSGSRRASRPRGAAGAPGP